MLSSERQLTDLAIKFVTAETVGKILHSVWVYIYLSLLMAVFQVDLG